MFECCFLHLLGCIDRNKKLVYFTPPPPRSSHLFAFLNMLEVLFAIMNLLYIVKFQRFSWQWKRRVVILTSQHHNPEGHDLLYISYRFFLIALNFQIPCFHRPKLFLSLRWYKCIHSSLSCAFGLTKKHFMREANYMVSSCLYVLVFMRLFPPNNFERTDGFSWNLVRSSYR